ncbi:hypothetical protein HD599_001171 [Conyzicola lurida]|uniref:Uncharacterized protein n=1 Tax=Conyzicola lurida TaxID=1172621 RepID=A0A841AKH8_9MICO|nr:hypothetical protein [Conyzicola lurida]MBB5842848.1 hypothetical protein [Conyzicola lurida]
MIGQEDELERVRFYGAHDLASGWHAPRVAEIADRFDPADPPKSVMDVLELHNVQQYLQHRMLPRSCPEEDVERLVALVPQIRSAVAKFFGAVDGSNFAQLVADVDLEYGEDLIEVLGRSKAFERIPSGSALPALTSAGFHVGQLLTNKKLVQAYDTEMRNELLALPRGAELLVRKYLEKDPRGAIQLPASFTPADCRDLLERYIDSEDANLNYVRLIASANDNAQIGIDAKLKLRAKRRASELNAKLFEENKGFKTGCEVSISDDQDEPVRLKVDTSEGSIRKYVYSKRWLEVASSNASVLNNFQHLFEFADQQVLLTLPSYRANFGVLERTMGLTGTTEYKVGSNFQAADARTLLQTRMYRQFLLTQEVDLERVIAWFFQTYLVEEFGATGFSFAPSAGDRSYLQKVRHLFAEMESVANQFTLFAENGELDRDLMTMSAEQVRYKTIPSLLDGKYLYPSESEEIAGVLHLLFSDQSRLKYIDETLRAENTVKLLLTREVAYEDFREYQRPSVDHLIQLGVLRNTGTRVQLTNMEQTLILSYFNNTEAANYHHLSITGRVEADALVARGWATRRSSLFTDAEGDYFNYFLNKVGFSNGPNLRNRYLHGSQTGADDESTHFNTYLVALRLITALVIKINDDFCLANVNSSTTERS